MEGPVGVAALEGGMTDARAFLLAHLRDGHWRGRLSSSALSTALACQALALAGIEPQRRMRGCAWLATHQNDDGGWGDTPGSPANPSTTLLVRAALAACRAELPQTIARAETWLSARLPGDRMQAIADHYGEDRTFAVPIHMACALAGTAAWAGIRPLPFELAAVPRWCWSALRLTVVSYAVPALVAVGACVQRHRPSRAWLRRLAWPRAERLLSVMQPASGGYLEAIPLTAFVAMAMTDVAGAGHPVVQRALAFLVAAQREDGSWPIDSDLACWVTSAALAALDPAARSVELAPVRAWLAAAQHRQVHPFTGAAPGGWAWTDLPGGVPDADDTAGAVLALAGDPAHAPAVRQGVDWLLAVQNRDGGWPTFCRGWGHLPFDRSCADITAHVLRALHATGRGAAAVQRGLAYLERTQRDDGAWLPLWFGDQRAEQHENPVLGTARVLRSLELWRPTAPMTRRGQAYLRGTQQPDGSWNGQVETTALAVAALAGSPEAARGADWLMARIADGSWTDASPIGLYFASLWYDEALYPVIWTVEALERQATARGRGAYPIQGAAA
jgi:squalene-hopene/tetraprenyl-beta-curcumene cyclase